MIHYFGIGLSKTGTKSLCKAFKMMGFKSKHFFSPTAFKNIEAYEFANDLPVPIYYKELDKRFMNPKFILTVRDMDAWLDSCERHWKKKNYKGGYRLNYRTKMYGRPDYDRESLQLAYKAHDWDVRHYFKRRPEDLLVFDMFNGDSWRELIDFIGEDNVRNSIDENADFPWVK